MGKSYPAVPSSSAQNLIITTGNLLHFSAWHKMILTGIQHSNLLHLSASHKMTITGIQHVYLTSCQIPLANNKHQLQKYCLRVSMILQGAAIWPLLTAYALGYTYKSNTVCARALLHEGTAGGLSPKHWIWERGAPPQMPKILVSVSF